MRNENLFIDIKVINMSPPSIIIHFSNLFSRDERLILTN